MIALGKVNRLQIRALATQVLDADFGDVVTTRKVDFFQQRKVKCVVQRFVADLIASADVQVSELGQLVEIVLAVVVVVGVVGEAGDAVVGDFGAAVEVQIFQILLITEDHVKGLVGDGVGAAGEVEDLELVVLLGQAVNRKDRHVRKQPEVKFLQLAVALLAVRHQTFHQSQICHPIATRHVEHFQVEQATHFPQPHVVDQPALVENQFSQVGHVAADLRKAEVRQTFTFGYVENLESGLVAQQTHNTRLADGADDAVESEPQLMQFQIFYLGQFVEKHFVSWRVDKIERCDLLGPTRHVFDQRV